MFTRSPPGAENAAINAVWTRPLRIEDAPALARLVTANRAHLAPWEPERNDMYFTTGAQAAVIKTALAEQAAGRCVALAIVDHTNELIGRVTLNSIIRGALQSASIGYWVSATHTGRGVATIAVAQAVTVAFKTLQLHRVQAEILPHNVASEAVLRKNGFLEYGTAPSYLKIGGRWQDHRLFQRLRATP